MQYRDHHGGVTTMKNFDLTSDVSLTALGMVLSELRWRSRITCEDLGKEAEVPVATIKELEAGQIDIDMLTLFKLLSILRVDAGEFFLLLETKSQS